MKNCIILFVLCYNFYFSLYAQDAFKKFGEASLKEVSATQNEKFPDAEAVILCDYAKAYYDMNGTEKLIVQRFTRIKILKKSGYEYANKTAYFTVRGNGKEFYSNVKGTTYNLEHGEIIKTKLEKNMISEKMIGKHLGELKFTLPNVKEGSVIEYSYELTSDFLGYIPTWYFQNEIPTLWSEFEVKVPSLFDFVRLSQVYRVFDVARVENPQSSLDDGINYRWAMKEIPAFKDEAFIASVEDHIMKMEFQLKSVNYRDGTKKLYWDTWNSLIKDLLEDEKYGKFLNKSLPDKNILQTLTAGKTTPKDKALAIYEYVKNNFKCNGRTGLRTRQSFKDLWEKKTGNITEINLLLINMLKEIDIEAIPVISSTRWHGKVFQEYPLIDKFNYTLVYINVGEEMLLDATEPMLSAGMIAYQALNGRGLLLQKEKSGQPKWVSLQLAKSKNKNSVITVANFTIQADGIIKGKIDDRFGGYEAIRMRRKALKEGKNDEEDDEEETDLPVRKFVSGEHDEVQKINQYTFKNLEEFDKPLDATKNIEVSDYSQVNDEFIYFTPLLEYRIKENPLKNATRDFPIDYACPNEQSFYMNFAIPDGYKVEELPKPLRLKWQDESVKFDYSVSVVENKVQLVSKFIITRPIFSKEEYAPLRDLYAQIVAKQEEQIVLKKK
jgi:hypothetical protein